MRRRVHQRIGSTGFALISGRTIGILCLMVAILVTSVCITGCVSNSLAIGNVTSKGLSDTSADQVQRVEIYHFHRTQQCYSCKTVGAFAEETVKTRFSNELQSGRVVFGHINIELPENKALVDQYGPTGSSLWIGVYNKTGFHKEEDLRVWYKIGDKEEYVAYLSTLIQKRLNGDLS
jgi:hypothetical protein